MFVELQNKSQFLSNADDKNQDFFWNNVYHGNEYERERAVSRPPRSYSPPWLEQLESVKIGYGCFRISFLERRDDGVCRISNCPNLRQLEIGNESFRDFNQFELSNVNSLQSIQFGDWCFYYADNCILRGECE